MTRRKSKSQEQTVAAPGLRLEWRSPAELAENPRNWRRHPESQLKALAGAVSEVGWAGACLYNEATGRLIDGHARRKVAQEQGCELLPVLVGSWTEEQEAKILATLDPLAGMAEADPVMLDQLLRGVETGCPELADMIEKVWEDAQAGAIAEVEPADPVDAEPQTDHVAELREKWGTAAGQLWLLGKHRLLCGDSTKPEDVARVMGGEKADCVLTDPPYGQNQDGVPGDEPKRHTELMRAAVACLPVTDGIVVAFQSPRTFHAWTDATRAAGMTFERMLWMYKAAQCTFPWRGWILKSESIPASSIGNAAWQDVKPYSHDCYYLSEVSGELAENSGWHGSVKPMSVVVDLLKRICPEGGAVFDGFFGSGTTLIAAENLGRRCFGLEISPAYCAVILQRYADAFPDQEIRQA